MSGRLRYIGRAISLFFRLFIVRPAKVMFLPGYGPEAPSVIPPPVVARAEKRASCVLTVVSFLVVIPCLALPFLWGGKGHQYIAFAGLAVLCVVYKVWKTLGVGGVSGLCREARGNDCCLCLHCGYSLKGLPAEHRCPECGTPHEIEDVKRKWSAYLADRAARRLPW